MHKAERTILYSLAGAAMVFALRAGGAFSTAGAALAAQPGGATREHTPSRIATCDVISLIERMMQTQAFFAPRKQEEERIRAELAPLQAALQTLRDDLQGADPKKPENQAKAKDYQMKQKEFEEIYKDLQDKHAQLVVKQFAEAYDKVSAVLTKLSREQGFTHVTSQRAGKITLTTDAQKFNDEFLSRPFTVFPEGSDLTEATRIELNLPEKSENATELPKPPSKDKKK